MSPGPSARVEGPVDDSHAHNRLLFMTIAQPTGPILEMQPASVKRDPRRPLIAGVQCQWKGRVRYTAAMRVIAGRYRGRRLLTPAGFRSRPILDRVKAPLFDWLGSRLAQPGELPPVEVLDIFCGAGSLGIESLSRGAARCVFVETDPSALQCLRRNIEQLGLGRVSRIEARPAELLRIREAGASGFGLIFLDPPYDLSMNLEPGSVMGRVMERVGKEVPSAPGALLLWRHPAGCSIPSQMWSWTSSEQRVWGRMAITLFENVGKEHA